MLLLPVVGYGYAHWEHGLGLSGVGDMVLVVAAWGLLHAGTMWLNANLDRDRGPVLFGDAGSFVPSAAAAGHVALTGAPLVAAFAGRGPGLCAATCAALAVAYSHPRLAWKGHAVFGPAINVVGYGVLSPAAGWLVVGRPVTPRTVLMVAVFCSFIFALYLNAQCFQRSEDQARGYRTLVVTHGARGVQRAMRAAWLIGAGALLAMCLRGWLPELCAPAILLVPPLVRTTVASPTARDALRSARVALAYGIALLALAWAEHLQGVAPTIAY